MSEEKKDDKGNQGGGTSGGGKDDKQVDQSAVIADLQRQIAELKKSSSPPPKDDQDLAEKARKEREEREKTSGREKQIESAVRFNMGVTDFFKTNESLIPKEFSDILQQAEKEKFSDAIEKDGAIKSGLIQSFFGVQANVDLLTAGQKSTLDEYLKLTKTEKQNRAQSVYDVVFEPAFEMLKRIKKAEALSKGYGGGTDAETAYKNKLMASTRKHYLGEK